jgi:hypothetical protein
MVGKGFAKGFGERQGRSSLASHLRFACEIGAVLGVFSHQPLDVGCFSPLKTAYSKQIEHLVKNKIHHITKVEFLPAFKQAFNQVFTLSNI